MAKSEHIQIARQGTRAITWWREQHPGERLDFSGAILSNHNLNVADLSGADFTGADLIGALLNHANLRRAILKDAVSLMGHLNGADLSEADLTDAILRRADLTGATLVGATLDGANLNGANLSGAKLNDASLDRASLSETNLTGADLKGADLNRADLNYADLTGVDLAGANLGKATLFRTTLKDTNLRGAVLFHTVFGDCDLSVATGLDRVKHAGPSAVGIDTIFRSGGKIPADFLRGAGLPEDVVVNYQPIAGKLSRHFYTCFYIPLRGRPGLYRPTSGRPRGPWDTLLALRRRFPRWPLGCSGDDHRRRGSVDCRGYRPGHPLL